MTIPASKKNTPQTLQNNATDLLVQCIYVVVHFLSQVIFLFLLKNTNNYLIK